MAKKASLRSTSAKAKSAKTKSAKTKSAKTRSAKPGKAKASRRKRQAGPTIAPTTAAAPASRRAPAPAPSPAATTDGTYRAKIRMYRQGLGDCFLISLPRKQPLAGRSDYVIMIDCGVILGTSNPEEIMTKVVDDIVATTKGEVDLLIVTHEHWDHVSGFVQAEDAFKNLKVHDVWFAWTEDPNNALANQLRQSRNRALTALRLGLTRLQLGDDPQAEQVGGVLEFFGAAKGASTGDALAKVKAMVEKPRYCLPADNPVALAEAGVNLYVLGPPPDEKKLRKINPSGKDKETYGLALAGLDTFLDGPAKAMADDDSDQRPFSTLYEIPLPIAREMDFFKQRYFRPGTSDEDWRQIDTAWLVGSAELALQLDSLTNNTSLVLAIELADKDVLLFVADAQVGNWLSWQDLNWMFGGRSVTGPDLLRNAIFYKVGHHGSHNATLQKLGLEMMEKLRVAMIPVDEMMAKKKRWNQMPLGDLVTALQQRAKGAVIRVDQPLPASTERLTAQPLYYEVTL